MRLALVFLVGCGSSMFFPPDGGFDDEPLPEDGGGPITTVDAEVCTMICGGNCTDTASDPMNCGSCGHACTGSASACVASACVIPGATRWAKAFPGQINAVATDELGNVYAAGAFSGTLDLGQGIVLTSAGGTDILVGEWSPSGVPLWAKQLGGAGDDAGTALAYANGNLYLAATFTGTLIVDGFSYASAGGTDIALMSMTENGANTGIDTYGGEGDDRANALIYSASLGRPAVCGAFGAGTFHFGGGSMVSQATSTGFVIWSAGVRVLGDTTAGHASACTGVAADSLASLDVAGSFQGTGPFGTAATTTGYLAQLRLDNTIGWWHTFTGGTSTATALALDAGGNPFVVGNFSGTVDFGGGALTATTASDAFVASFTRAGSPSLSRRYGDLVTFTSAAVDGTDLVVTGRATGATPDFGAALGGDDLVLARLSGTAIPFAKRLGGSGADGGTAIAVGPGAIVIAGAITGSVDVGTGPLTGPAVLWEINP